MNVINRIKPIWKYSFLLVVLALTAFGTFQVLSKSLHAARSDSRDEPTPGNPESSIDASGLEARIVFNTTGSESDDDPTGGSRPEDTLVNFELHVDSSVAQIEDSKHKSSDEPLCGSPRRKDEGNPQIHNEDYKVLIKRIGDLEQLAETALRSYSELEKKHTQLVAATRKFREHTLQVEKDLRQKIN